MPRMLALAIVLAVVAATGAATDPGARCAATKLKAAARKSSAELKCHANATGRGLQVDPACLAKADAKFTAAWLRIEAAGGCRTTQDGNSVESRVDAFVAGLAVTLAPCGTVDGVCAGSCPFGLNCFEIGVGCFGEPEPCRCHGSTTTCPPSTTTTTTQP